MLATAHVSLASTKCFNKIDDHKLVITMDGTEGGLSMTDIGLRF